MPDRQFDLLSLLRRCGGDANELARQLAGRDDDHAEASNRHVASLSGDQMVERIKQIIYRHAQLVQAVEAGNLTTGERALLVVVRDFEGALVESVRWLVDNERATDVPVGDDTLVFSMNGLMFGNVLSDEEDGQDPPPPGEPRPSSDDLWSSG